MITELLRLQPPIYDGLPRVTLKEGLQIRDTFIPGGVLVSVP